MSNVVTLLKYLASLGPKLPEALAVLEAMVASLQTGAAALAELFGGKPLSFSAAAPVELTAEEQALCNECESHCASAGFAAGPDGSLLTKLLTFLKAHPELLAFVLKLFVK